VLLNGDIKKLHEDIVLMERDFGNEVKSLHNELTDANNTIQTLENDLRIQEQNDQADKGRLDEDWKAHC